MRIGNRVRVGAGAVADTVISADCTVVFQSGVGITTLAAAVNDTLTMTRDDKKNENH